MNKAKHAFGQSADIEAAKQANKINAFDILFLDGDTAPKVGWLDSQGNTVIVDHRADLSKVEAELEAEIAAKANSEDVKTLESQIATKADASEIETLQTEIANKVDAETVQSMIEEHSESAIEVVEF